MPEPRTIPAPQASFLEGGGELGALMRAHDWEATPLGPPAGWPRALKTAVRILLTSRQPFWLGWGPDLTYLYNDAYKAIIGGKHPTALGRPFREVWSEIWDVVGPMADRVMEQDEGTYVEAQLLMMERHGYTEETYYTFSYSPVPDDDGRPMGLICANTDDTQRVLGERQLATLRELAARTAPARTWREACALGVAALGVDPRDLPFAALYLGEPGEVPRLVAASPGAEAVARGTHWPWGEVLAADAMRTWPIPAGVEVPRGPWPDAAGEAAVLPVAATGTGRRGVLVLGLNPYRRLDEGYRTFLELVAGQLASALATAEGYEEAQQRADALAELDRAKTAFFSNVSHEFRTPLTLMLGPLEDLLAEADDAPPHVRAPVETAHRNAVRLLKLVNTLLDFSRIEAGRVDASYEAVDLAAFTSELASLFRSAIERVGLTFTVACPPLPHPVHVDREMWEKVVFNLLSNAFKFTFDGEIALRLAATSQGARLEVSDTGTGIPDSELPHLFERFHRVRGARGRSFEGTGIGLALVQELVRLHGGTVEVDSTVDRGTTFRVTVPFGTAHLPAERIGAPRNLAPTAVRGEAYVQEMLGWTGIGPGLAVAPTVVPAMARTSHPPSMAAEVSEGGVPRVLVVDDNGDMRDYVRRLLGSDYDVQTAPNGAAGLVLARRWRPDLVLSDIMMPELDGFGLLRELRADDRLRTVPVILLSARAGEEARLDGLAAGADDYLVKPFSAKELLARVSGRLELSRLQRRLDQERSNLQHVFAHLPVPVGVLSGPSLTVDLANPALIEMVGSRRVFRRALHEALPELDGTEVPVAVRQVLATGSSYRSAPMPVQFPPRQPVWLTCSYAPLRGADGEVASVVMMWFDVTDQVRGRDAISEAGGPAARRRPPQGQVPRDPVAHRLPQPARPLRNALHLQRLSSGQAPPQVREMMERQVDHLVRLVDDLLEMSRINRGKFELRQEAVDLATVIRNALETSQSHIDAGHHEVKVASPSAPV
ncbi:MAG: ATP-binding protein [Myxococcota bacterium]